MRTLTAAITAAALATQAVEVRAETDPLTVARFSDSGDKNTKFLEASENGRYVRLQGGSGQTVVVKLDVPDGYVLVDSAGKTVSVTNGRLTVSVGTSPQTHHYFLSKKASSPGDAENIDLKVEVLPGEFNREDGHVYRGPAVPDWKLIGIRAEANALAMRLFPGATGPAGELNAHADIRDVDGLSGKPDTVGLQVGMGVLIGEVPVRRFIFHNKVGDVVDETTENQLLAVLKGTIGPSVCTDLRNSIAVCVLAALEAGGNFINGGGLLLGGRAGLDVSFPVGKEGTRFGIGGVFMGGQIGDSNYVAGGGGIRLGR